MDKKTLEASADKVLAYTKSSYYVAAPVVVLSLTLWEEFRTRTGSHRTVRRAPAGARVGESGNWDFRTTGYPAVKFYGKDAEENARKFLASGLTLSDLIDGDGIIQAVPGFEPGSVRFEILNNRYLVGDWDTVQADYAATRAEDKRLREERNREQERQAAVLAEVRVRLADLGFDERQLAALGSPDATGRVSIKVDMLLRVAKEATGG